jgi:hypothetical protein
LGQSFHQAADEMQVGVSFDDDMDDNIRTARVPPALRHLKRVFSQTSQLKNSTHGVRSHLIHSAHTHVSALYQLDDLPNDAACLATLQELLTGDAYTSRPTDRALPPEVHPIYHS